MVKPVDIRLTRIGKETYSVSVKRGKGRESIRLTEAELEFIALYFQAEAIHDLHVTGD